MKPALRFLSPFRPFALRVPPSSIHCSFCLSRSLVSSLPSRYAYAYSPLSFSLCLVPSAPFRSSCSSSPRTLTAWSIHESAGTGRSSRSFPGPLQNKAIRLWLRFLEEVEKFRSRAFCRSLSLRLHALSGLLLDPLLFSLPPVLPSFPPLVLVRFLLFSRFAFVDGKENVAMTATTTLKRRRRGRDSRRIGESRFDTIRKHLYV